MDTLSTQEKLLQIGKDEFLAKGFKDASLREIAKKAGYTLGAFYGYYDSKEALFDAIVREPSEALYDHFYQVQTAFSNLPDQEQAGQLEAVSEASLSQMLDYIYESFDIFKLVFFRSAGTAYETYMQKFVEQEVRSTYHFIDILKKQGHEINIDEELIHILASAMFSGLLEVVDHDMSKEKAVQYIAQLRSFYSAGWFKLLGL